MISKIITLFATFIMVALAHETDDNTAEWSQWGAISPTCTLVGIFGGWLE